MLRKNLFRIVILLLTALNCLILLGMPASFSPVFSSPVFSAPLTQVFLPLVVKLQAPEVTSHKVNAPFFNGDVRYEETAILWFGQVTSISNYADVRIGYNDTELYVNLNVFDRYLQYDTTPSAGELADWDAATLYLRLNGNTGDAPDTSAYRFVAQLNWWEPRTNYQAADRGNGVDWIRATVPFAATTGWRGDAPNDNNRDDRGWAATFRIPFASLGLTSAPPSGTVWGLAMALHDRDDAVGTPILDQRWPPALNGQSPATWGQLGFGLPTYTPPAATPRETVVIRDKLNGQTVQDAAVGGTINNLCPGDTNFIWNQWGNANFAGAGEFNIQNQSDVADWPCFAKYYVTFPLGSVPTGKAIISATLTLHQFGNSGGGSWGTAYPSWIQVLTVGQNWNESTLTWNNAPLAKENVGGTWADHLDSFPGWPGAPRTWDVSRAVAAAYQSGQPVRLALYEADSAYHSGKYFVSSETGDWNAAGRPTLRVLWGDP